MSTERLNPEGSLVKAVVRCRESKAHRSWCQLLQEDDERNYLPRERTPEVWEVLLPWVCESETELKHEHQRIADLLALSHACGWQLETHYYPHGSCAPVFSHRSGKGSRG